MGLSGIFQQIHHSLERSSPLLNLSSQIRLKWSPLIGWSRGHQDGWGGGKVELHQVALSSLSSLSLKTFGWVREMIWKRFVKLLIGCMAGISGHNLNSLIFEINPCNTINHIHRQHQHHDHDQHGDQHQLLHDQLNVGHKPAQDLGAENGRRAGEDECMCILMPSVLERFFFCFSFQMTSSLICCNSWSQSAKYFNF